MTLINRVTLAIVAALSVAACSHASDSGTGGGGDNAAQPGAAGAMNQGGAARMHRMGRILEGLNLTDDQKSKIKAIFADTRAKNRGLDPATRRANMLGAFAQIDTILTPAQRTEFDAKTQAMRNAQTPAPSQ